MQNVQFPEVSEAKVYTKTQRIIPGYKQIWDKSTGNSFAVLTKLYKLTPHEEMLEVADAALFHSPEYGKVRKNIRLFDDGAKMRATYVFPEVEVEIQHGDKVNPQIEIFNSYDGRWGRKIFFGAFRLLCSNGLVVGKKLYQYVASHSTEFNQKEVEKMLVSSMEELTNQAEFWKRWVDEVVTPEKYEKIMEQMPLSKKDLKVVESEVEVSSEIMLDAIRTRTLSMWIFFNILAQYCSHHITNHGKRVAVERAMRKAFY